MLRLLLRTRWWQWRNQVLRGGSARGQLLLVLLFNLGFLGFLGQWSRAFFVALAQVDPSLAGPALTGTLAGLGGMAVVSALALSLHRLFLAPDLELWLAAPLSPRELFGVGVLDVWLGLLFLILFAVATLVGAEMGLGAPFPGYLLVVPVALLVALLGALAGLLLVLVASRLVPVGRLRALVPVLGLLTVGMTMLVTYALFSFGEGRSLPGQVAPSQVAARADQIRSVGERLAWTPLAWLADALAAPADERWVASLGDLVGAGLAGAALAGGAYPLFGRTALVWQGQAQAARVRTRTAQQPALVPRLLEPVPGPIRAVALKDWRALPRDPHWLSGLLVPLATLVAVGVAFTVPLLRSGAGGPSGDRGFWLAVAPVALFPQLAASVAARALAHERQSFWLLRAAPVRMGQVLATKALAYGLPVVACTWLVTAVVGIWRGASLGALLAALGMGGWLAAGLVVTNLAAGALDTRFDADNPLQAVGCLGQAVAQAASWLFFLPHLALFAWLVLGGLGALPGGMAALGLVLPPLLGALALAALAGVAILARVAVWRLENHEETA